MLEPAGFSNASAIAGAALSNDAPGSVSASPGASAADGAQQSNAGSAPQGQGQGTRTGSGRRVRHVKTHRVWANGTGWEPIPVKELVAGWLSGTELNYGSYSCLTYSNEHTYAVHYIRITVNACFGEYRIASQ